MEVLIVSKTNMSNAACVGGLVLSNKRNVRLLNPGNYNQPANTEFEIGDVYDMDFTERTHILPPHVEDVIVSSKAFLRKVDDMPAFLSQQKVLDWSGSIMHLFDNLLSWTDGKAGYIPAEGQLPGKSVGFWMADKDLIRAPFKINKVQFLYPNGSDYKKISFVGLQDTVAIIPAGTILRVSLSRLYPVSENFSVTTHRGFYLQLSGWY